jgi:superfamily II DNA or RNA helicase
MNNETKTRKIYVYSTDTYLKKGWVKIGETHQTVEERVKQQDGTACPEPLLVLDQWPSPVYSDTDIHAQLRKMGILPVREDASREWYACTLPQVKSAFNQLTQGVARPNSYSMRPEQQDCCDKIVGHFNSGGERFLMNAKMRFGKTFTTYQAIKALGYKKVLILTYKPQVSASWSSDLEKHVDFNRFSKMHRAKEGMPTFEDNMTIVFESFQQLLHKSGKTANKNKSTSWIYDVDWDLIVIDEEHYGAGTAYATAILEKLPTTAKTLSLSGTPYKTLASGEYSDEEIFSWTYVDEQKKKNEGSEPHQCMPTMKFHTFNIHPSVIKEADASGYNDEDGFRIEKMFATKDNKKQIKELKKEKENTNDLHEREQLQEKITCLKASDKKFEYPSAVDAFLTTIGQKRVKGQSWSPYQSDDIDNRLLDHMLWMLPMSIDSVTALCDMLRKHPNFGQRGYHIINASGTNTVNIKDVKHAIKKNSKTITVSCGRFDTGVTVPEWKTVIMLDGSKSAEKYFQTIFRAQSPLKGHDECLVIDFNPQRTLELVYDYCSYTAKASDSTEESIREFFEVASLLEHGANGLVERDVGDVMMAMSRSASYIEHFSNARNICSNNADEKLFEALADLTAEESTKIEVLLGSTNEVEKGKISKTLTQSEKTALKDALDDIKKKAQTALKRIPTYLFITTDIEQNCNDIIEKGSDSDLFEEVTGISADIFGHALDIGFLDRSSLDRSIADFGYRESKITLDNFLTQD